MSPNISVFGGGYLFFTPFLHLPPFLPLFNVNAPVAKGDRRNDLRRNRPVHGRRESAFKQRFLPRHWRRPFVDVQELRVDFAVYVWQTRITQRRDSMAWVFGRWAEARTGRWSDAADKRRPWYTFLSYCRLYSVVS